MEKKLLIYLAIANPILLKGFEGIIVSHIDPNAEVVLLSKPHNLFEINFNYHPDSTQIVVYDSSQKNDQVNLLLFNLLKDHPFLKGILMTNEFDYKQVKLYFNMGISGVLNDAIEPHDFIDFFADILEDKKSLSPFFREHLVKHFCQGDKEFNAHKNSKIAEEEINHFEEIYGLTKREKEILCLICNGKNTKEISEELFISLHTAETHRRNILSKLDVKNTAEMVKVAILNRLVAV